jgi:hypothetical protein
MEAGASRGSTNMPRCLSIVPSRLNAMTACDLFGVSIFADGSDLKIAMWNLRPLGRLRANH